METLLFVPPAAVSPKPPQVKDTDFTGFVFAAIILAVVVALFSDNSRKQKTQTNPTSLKPVVGAFGWKLGDKLPEQLRPKLREGSYHFAPEEKIPPFDDYTLSLTEDGRIYEIEANGNAESYDDFETYQNALISLLSEKYGRRPKDRDPSIGVGADFFFGSDDQRAHLNIDGISFTLHYRDCNLWAVAYNERAAKRKKDADEKKAALKNGL